MAKFGVNLQKQNKNSTGDTFLSGGMGFEFQNFPAFLCNARDADVIFYSLVPIYSVTLALGGNLLIMIFWMIHKVSS